MPLTTQAVAVDPKGLLPTADLEGSVKSKRNNQNDGVTVAAIGFSVTGVAAHGRLAPLLPRTWNNRSPYNNENQQQPPPSSQSSSSPHTIPQFLWENAPRN
eukprot:CAMPEP_0172443900 /NCGR_PEP_ID=MMETSP1065-20121228/4090_1 /TAXON_ID=265537 /ORGANISM="Amphiprora paludosa, Strain CCMP125" /LENGTH=100 /DNA_ID=CAMNT_0013194291 /DNA_START=51 /DNA_END=350 /DNA_ORIENTATION=+